MFSAAVVRLHGNEEELLAYIKDLTEAQRVGLMNLVIWRIYDYFCKSY